MQKKSHDISSLSFKWTYDSNPVSAIAAEAKPPDTNFPNYLISAEENYTGHVTHQVRPGPWFYPESFDVGSYALDYSTHNMFYHYSYVSDFPVISGTLNITSNQKDLLSGNFNAIVVDLVGHHVG